MDPAEEAAPGHIFIWRLWADETVAFIVRADPCYDPLRGAKIASGQDSTEKPRLVLPTRLRNPGGSEGDLAHLPDEQERTTGILQVPNAGASYVRRVRRSSP